MSDIKEKKRKDSTSDPDTKEHKKSKKSKKKHDKSNDEASPPSSPQQSGESQATTDAMDVDTKKDEEHKPNPTTPGGAFVVKKDEPSRTNPAPVPQVDTKTLNRFRASAPKPIKHPNRFDIALSKERRDGWRFGPNVGAMGTHLEFGAVVVFGERDKNVTIQTPISKVGSANLHGVGVPDQEAPNNHSKRQYKLKTIMEVDEETKKEDPNIEVDQEKFVELMAEARERVVELILDEPAIAKATKDAVWKAAILGYIEKNAEVEESLKLKRDKKGKIDIGQIPENVLNTLKGVPEIRAAAIEDLGTRVQDWVFSGDDKYAADDKPIYRYKGKTFFKKKKSTNKEGEQEEADKGARKMPSKFKKGKEKEEEEEKKDEENEDVDDDLLFVEQRYDELPDKKVKEIIVSMSRDGYIHNRYNYFDHKGAKLQLGNYANDPNYRVIGQNDYIQNEFGIWVSSKKGGTGIRIKLQLGRNIWVIKEGIPDSATPMSDMSGAGKDFVPRPKGNIVPEEDPSA
jgi:hypothetical protein